MSVPWSIEVCKRERMGAALDGVGRGMRHRGADSTRSSTRSSGHVTGRTSTSATSADVPATAAAGGSAGSNPSLAQRLAQRTLPRSVYRSLLAGSERSATVADNSAAYHELGLAPVVLGQTARPSLATTVMDQSLSMPVLISPTGSQAVHPDAEVAIAHAAAARGTANGLSMFASKPIEDVIATNAKTFFQLYWIGDQ